ncbi:MAG: thioredoxin [Clostridiales bacterium]|nr:thioredoxin [Clostridiales bacterium]
MAETVINVNKDNFDKLVINSDKPVLVDFWASWCGPCRTVGPIIEQLAQEYEGKVLVVKVNVDEESELAAKFRIMSIPTVILFKGGQAAGKIIGARGRDELKALIDSNL